MPVDRLDEQIAQLDGCARDQLERVRDRSLQRRLLRDAGISLVVAQQADALGASRMPPGRRLQGVLRVFSVRIGAPAAGDCMLFLRFALEVHILQREGEHRVHMIAYVLDEMSE